MNFRLTFIFTYLFFLTCLIQPTYAQQSTDLATNLKTIAERTIEHCQKHDLKSVGVLKFLVAKNGEEFSDNVGTLNLLLARRLEVALVLANDPRKPVTLIEDASAIATTIEGANHLTKDGRAKLLSAKYPAMWGSEKVQPDLLITGIVEVGTELTTLTISPLVFDKTSQEIQPLGDDLLAAIRPALLVEVGESFSTRGAFDGGKIGGSTKTNSSNNSSNPPADLPTDADPLTTAALTSALKLHSTDATASNHPLNDPQSPVRMQMLYDGQPVSITVENGVAMLPEPRAGQRVEIAITKDATPARYAVVVKVNGQNSLYKQQLPDAACAKWLLSRPGQQQLITGFQLPNNQQRESFRVLSDVESADREISYGTDVGTITVSVFSEGTQPVLELNEDLREAQLVEKSQLPVKKSSTFGALKAKLLADANRGLIAEGAITAGNVNVVKFNPSDTPIMSATVKYYRQKQ